MQVLFLHQQFCCWTLQCRATALGPGLDASASKCYLWVVYFCRLAVSGFMDSSLLMSNIHCHQQMLPQRLQLQVMENTLNARTGVLICYYTALPTSYTTSSLGSDIVCFEYPMRASPQ
ncbi:hypothetical protein ACQKWADRAFT_277309 [Trichoderma austrokoningii]